MLRTLQLVFSLMIFSYPCQEVFVQGRKRDYKTFDTNLSGEEECKAIQDYLKEAEEFRLWCINEEPSMNRCALACHNALHFPPSSLKCHWPRCNFSSVKFQDEHGLDLDLKTLSKNKVTLIAVVPSFASYSNYIMQMLERIGKLYPETTTSLFLPLDIAIPGEFQPEKFKLRKKEDSKVITLEETKPGLIGSHELYKFLGTLRMVEGDRIDIYTDRPVFFVTDGFAVERIVFPMLQTLDDIVAKLGGIRVEPDEEEEEEAAAEEEETNETTQEEGKPKSVESGEL
jgi:hypothetical protein